MRANPSGRMGWFGPRQVISVKTGAYQLLATGQTTQYSSELDDGYYHKGKTKSYNIMSTGNQSGTTNVDLTHLVSSTGVFVFATQTYTDAGKCGVFKAAGGETIVIVGSEHNAGTYTSVSANANTLVVTAGFVDDAHLTAATFKKREAISNNTVKDNNTGLMWLKNIGDQMGIAGDGAMPWTGQLYDIYAFAAACNTAGLGGYSDWRIPNVYEIVSIMDFEAPNSSPDNTAFPAWAGATVWTATTRTDDTTNAYYSGFTSGYIYFAVKTTGYSTMLVRGG